MNRSKLARAALGGALVGVLVALAYLLNGCAGSTPAQNRRTICGAVQTACTAAAAYCSQPTDDDEEQSVETFPDER